MEKIAIVFTINNKYVTPAYITIKSLIDNAKEDTSYECLILSENITSGNKKVLNKLVKNTKHKIMHINVRKENIITAGVTYSWPKEVYYRLYLCDILKTYDKIIYSDVDILFKGDLSEVWNESMEGIEIAAVVGEKNDKEVIMHQYYEKNIHKYIYWDGFMIMNLELMRKREWCIRCIKNIEIFRNRLKMFDLEIINLTATEIKPLPLRYVMLQSLYDNNDIEKSEDYLYLSKIYSKEYIENEKESTVIVHYAGKQGKPWLRKNPPDYYMPYLISLPLSLKLQNGIQKIIIFIRRKLREIKRSMLCRN